MKSKISTSLSPKSRDKKANIWTLVNLDNPILSYQRSVRYFLCYKKVWEQLYTGKTTQQVWISKYQCHQIILTQALDEEGKECFELGRQKFMPQEISRRLNTIILAPACLIFLSPPANLTHAVFMQGRNSTTNPYCNGQVQPILIVHLQLISILNHSSGTQSQFLFSLVSLLCKRHNK